MMLHRAYPLASVLGLSRKTAHSLRVSWHVLSGPPDHERRLMCGANAQAISLGRHAQGLEEPAPHRSGQKQWPGHTSVRMCIDQHTHPPRHRAEPKNKRRTKWGSGTEIAVATMAVTFAAGLPLRHIKQPEVRMAEASTGD